MASSLKKVAIIDGCRIPFQKSLTGYGNLMAYDMGRLAFKGLLHRTQIDHDKIDAAIVGTVVSEVTTSNVAREIVLGVGLPQKIPAYTVTMACISSNRAITNAVDLIQRGQADVVIAGGTDSVSDFPIRFKKKSRKKIMAGQKVKSAWQGVKWALKFRPSDFVPEIPEVKEFSVGLTMGQSCDRMAARLGVTRKEQDEYAARSHKLAAKAYEEGLLQKELYPVRLPPKFKTLDRDNLVRGDTSVEKLGKLRPAFVKKYGTLTAGNSSPLTDGASATLLMSEEVAKAMGYKIKALIRGYTYTAHDPLEQLLLGPAFSTPKVLEQEGLAFSDIDVFEFHEAFAGQIVSALKCLDSDQFAKDKLGRSKKVGEMPMDKFNTLGGSISLGHPFGATGARLVTTAANRLQREDGKFALIAACAAGAMSNAMILERPE